MEDYKRQIIEWYETLIVYGKRYKKGLSILTIIMISALVWGAFSEDNEEQRHLPSDAEHNFVDSEDAKETDQKEGKIIYDVSYSMRSMPWREVLIVDIGASKSENTANDELTNEEKIHASSKGGKEESSNKQKGSNKNFRNKVKNDESSINKENNQIEKVPVEERKSPPIEVKASVDGIVVGDVPYAVISIGSESRAMTVGEMWKSFSIIAINKGCVTVNRGGQEVCLDVGESLSI